MLFFVLMLTFVIAAIAVVYKVLTGYVACGVLCKIAVLSILTLSWFAPMWLRFLRRFGVSGMFYDVSYKIGYFMMGFVLILSMLIIARDILWYVVYLCSGKAHVLNPDNMHSVCVLNSVTIGLALLISAYGFFEAHQSIEIQNIKIEDERVKKETKFVVASDMHINATTPIKHIQNMISIINAQNPDYILLVGDIADDLPQKAIKKVNLLSALKAKKVYISLGNHEYYNRPYAWMDAFTKLNFEVLQNSGEELDGTGIYVGGVPDSSAASVNYQRTFRGSDHLYRILLAHTPADFKNADKHYFDMQFSGHTHGGQIFSFQYITKRANNGYLSGLYKEGKTNLFVMKGMGYWGPPMRVLATPDIVVFTLKP